GPPPAPRPCPLSPPPAPATGLTSSRRIDTPPSPPPPACTCSTTRSTKLVTGGSLTQRAGRGERPGPARTDERYCGMMLTTLRPRLVPNCTAPAASAKRVSSPPRPTRSPGWNLVPRCRTRISPALTTCPPNRLTPRRWAAESRPLRELDAPFL